MCGIVGYTGRQSAGPLIIDGLRRVEYRGYDSAGLALFGLDGQLHVVRGAGKLDALVQRVEGTLPEGHSGIGHTRWATHGSASDHNAHPQLDPDGRVAIVHNGIVENHEVLREQYARGAFASETDTEVLAHMVAGCVDRGMDLLAAVRRVAAEAMGSYSLVAVLKDQPGRLVAARVGNAGGIVVGHADGEHIVASDVGALLPVTRRVVFLGPGEFADISANGVVYVNGDGDALEKCVETVPYHASSAVRGTYRCFMEKEIFEQPATISDAISGRYRAAPIGTVFEGLPLDEAAARAITRVVLIGMGTSMHAAMVGRHYIERFAHIPAEVDNSAEFRYRSPVLDEHTLVISVAQSGETVDTLEAMAEAKRANCLQITLCNTTGAQTSRVADGTIYLRAGAERAVASTKTFIASVLMLHGLALELGRLRGSLDPAVQRKQVHAALQLPDALREVLESADEMERIAECYADYDNFFFLGRGLGHPLALEGALKLKEIAYIHAEGYSAAEMKHGPIALIDKDMPTLAITPRDALCEKMYSNIEQVRARGGRVIALVTRGDHRCDASANDVVHLPDVDAMLVPVVAAVPLQLLAYYIATLRGADVDQPRNLAKTVTVE